MLITPPYHSGVVESAGVWLNVGFVSIAGSLRAAGFEPIYYDAMSLWHGYDKIARTIEHERPDVVATTAFTAEIVDALRVLKLAKRVAPEAVTVIGNVHPTFMYGEVLTENDYVDFVVRGEGEHTMVELMQCLDQGGDTAKVKGLAFRNDFGITVTPTRQFISDLDTLPMAWDLVDWPIYTYKTMEGSTLAVVSSSRGCSSQCSFCSQQLFWQRQWRGKSPEAVVSELEMLREKFGVDVVMISDETPTLERERWERILDLKIKRGLDTKILMETRVDDIIRDEDIMEKYARAGVDHIYVGVESPSQTTLDIFKKDIKAEMSKRALDLINAQDMVSETSFVLGMPDETPEHMKETVEIAKHYNPDLAFFLAIAPWPYSDIYSQLEPYVATKDYSRYNLVEPVVKPENMTLDEVMKGLGQASMDFYMHKLETLSSMSSRKSEFMVKVVKLISEDSYLKEHMSGDMPERVKNALRAAGVS
ncbi:MAG: cobalamin-dependent protein [Thermodesulfovibrionales bacterium]|nr:cobalamin-dependent protein [Thermodesulfovibrionales bacterium]